MSQSAKSLTIVFLMTCVILPFQNCGSDGSSSSSSAAGSFATAHAPTLAELAGIWKGPCKAGSNNSSYRPAIELYANGKIAIAIGEFSDANCVTPASADLYTGTFTLGSSSVPSAGQVQFTITTAVRTPVNAAAASAFNSMSNCGYSAWAVNTPVSVPPGSACLSVPANASSLIAVSANLIFLGNTANTALDPAEVYTKQ